MDFRLPEETTQLVDELHRWAASRPPFEVTDADDAAGWSQLVAFGLFDLEADGGTVLDAACATMAAARTPLPGPLVEAQLAVAAAPDGGQAARRLLADGAVVTSLAPGPTGPNVVGWGARAALVVDQTGGGVLAEAPLPPVANAWGLPHGWVERTATGGTDAVLARRWLLTAAASTGLAAGVLDAVTRHARDREVFGRPLSSFQAVQLRLAESLQLLEGCELMVRDAAWRMTREDGAPDPVSAALTWLFVAPAVKRVTAHAHQVYGALGFATETGLVRSTSQAQWLRVSTPVKPAARLVTAARSRTQGTPPSLVLAGFTPWADRLPKQLTESTVRS